MLKLLSLVSIASCAVLVTSTCAAAPRPNIVFLLADDLGWTGLQCFGSDMYETPNLDRLAEDGLKFMNAYAACTVCSPTRASIMTGKYPARLHLTDFIAGQNRPFAKMQIPNWTKRLESKHVTIAEQLKAIGYRTGHFGKWHLESRGGKDDGTDPLSQGFDVSYSRPPGTKGYITNRVKSEAGTNYLTDILTDKACAFIDEVKDEPFFLYFAYNVPHTPIQGRPDLVERFTKKVDPNAIHKNPNYAAMVASLDESVGRVLARLNKHNIAERTLVIFTSDNGGLTQRNGKHDGFTENLPLRRGKGSAYEGGVRVPAIVHWPTVTKPGTSSDTPTSTIDYFATLLHAAHWRDDARWQIPATDGANLIPIFENPQKELGRDLYWHYPHYHAGGDGPYSAIRSGNWRLIEFHDDNSLALYNLKDDLGEESNLAATHPTRASELHDRLKRWRTSVDAQMPTPNPNFNAKRAAEVKRESRK